MVELTRSDVIKELESLGNISKEDMYLFMVTYAQQNSSNPDKLLDDLMSYPIYANRE